LFAHASSSSKERQYWMNSGTRQSLAEVMVRDSKSGESGISFNSLIMAKAEGRTHDRNPLVQGGCVLSM
jgi:hypothetical protein